MIKKLPESTGAVIGVKITSKVSIEEENEWLNKFDKAIAEHGKISILLVLDEQASWGTEAGIEDLKWVFNHLKQLNKIAVITESRVWMWLVTIDSPFAKLAGVKEKYFQPSKLVDAWLWIKA